MEYIEGDTFFKLCKNKKNKTCINYGKQICNLVDSLHNKGIIHNDLHLNNIMISKNNPIIIDWARAQITNDTLSWKNELAEQIYFGGPRWSKKPFKCY